MRELAKSNFLCESQVANACGCESHTTHSRTNRKGIANKVAKIESGRPGYHEARGVEQTGPILNPTIFYLLPIPRHEPADTSPFQGFNPGLLERLELLVVLRRLPADILELNFSKAACIAKRVGGNTSYSALPINADVLSQISPSLDQPFMVVFSDPSLFSQVKSWCDSQPIPVLHVSIYKSPGTITVSQLDSQAIQNHVRRVVQHIASNNPSLNLTLLRKITKKFRLWPKERLLIPRRNHYCVEPNQFVLDSLRVDFRGTKPLISIKNGPYFKAIQETTEAVLGLRSRVS
jgi:hypothetical protein